MRRLYWVLLLAVCSIGSSSADNIMEVELYADADDTDNSRDPTDPFNDRKVKDHESDTMMKGPYSASPASTATCGDIRLGHSLPDDSPNSAPHKSEKVMPSCDCSLPELLPLEKGELGSLVFMRRVVSSILHHITEDSVTGEYTASLSLSPESRMFLGRFVKAPSGGDTSGDIHEASEVLVNSINYIEPTLPKPSPLTHWLSEHQSLITAVLQIVLILLLTLVVLVITVKLWWGVGSKRFLIFMTVLAFCVSVPWTWVHLYKQNLAGRMKRSQIIVPECDPNKLSWREFIFYDYSGRCSTYYEDQHIDPLWEVKPTMAIAYTVVELFWKPLEIMGGPLGTFMRDFLEPLPFYVKPVAAVLGLMFAWWCLVLFSGMRVWTWFFTIEPAVTAKDELNSIKDTVQSLSVMIENTASSYERRDHQLQGVLERITSQVDRQDDMGEMVPVLQNMCADYAQQQNTPPQKAFVMSSFRGGEGAVVKSHGAGDIQQSPPTCSDMFSLARPDHVVLTTDNIDGAIKFYCTLGMIVKTFNTNRRALHFGEFKINLHRAGSEVAPHAENPSPGSLDLCIACSCVVETTLAHLKNNKVEIELGPVERTGALGKITSVYVRDPDRNLVELAHYTERVIRPPPPGHTESSFYHNNKLETTKTFANIGPSTDPL